VNRFARTVRRWDPLRVAVVALAIAVVLPLAAYGFDLTSTPATLDGLTAAVALIAVAGSGLLYAWRLGAGGLVE
jgi:hypothetical protein